MFWGREFQREAPAKDMLVLNKSSLNVDEGRGKESQTLYIKQYYETDFTSE